MNFSTLCSCGVVITTHVVAVMLSSQRLFHIQALSNRQIRLLFRWLSCFPTETSPRDRSWSMGFPRMRRMSKCQVRLIIYQQLCMCQHGCIDKAKGSMWKKNLRLHWCKLTKKNKNFILFNVFGLFLHKISDKPASNHLFSLNFYKKIIYKLLQQSEYFPYRDQLPSVKEMKQYLKRFG